MTSLEEEYKEKFNDTGNFELYSNHFKCFLRDKFKKDNFKIEKDFNVMTTKIKGIKRFGWTFVYYRNKTFHLESFRSTNDFYYNSYMMHHIHKIFKKIINENGLNRICDITITKEQYEDSIDYMYIIYATK